MQPLFITATGTGVGKTFATLALLVELAERGLKVGAFKPVESGFDIETSDAAKLLAACKLLNPTFSSVGILDICPVRYELPAAPFVAKGSTPFDFEAIKSAYEKLSKLCDIVLIEGAGGLLSPVELDFFSIDFAAFFNAKTLLVTHDSLGCINDLLLSLAELEKRQLKFRWCVNIRDEEGFRRISLPYLEPKFGKLLSLQNDIKYLAEWAAS